MKLTYTSADGNTIEVMLDKDEMLGNIAGPTTLYVPCDPANVEYAAIVKHNHKINPYVPPKGK
jgi:hypothetical protein